MALVKKAGFSRSNRYHVVKQDQISSCASMNYSELLDMLKEIAGTRGYKEEMRESPESKQKIDLCEEKEKIILEFGKLDYELQKLNNEKEEFEKLKRLVKQLKYAMEHREHDDARQKLFEINYIRENVSGEVQELTDRAIYCINLFDELSFLVHNLNSEVQSLMGDYESLRIKRADAEQRVAELQTNYKALQRKINSYTNEETLRLLGKQYEGYQADLNGYKQSYDIEVRNEETLNRRIQAIKMQLPYQKQGRSTQFPSETGLRREILDHGQVLSSDLVQKKFLSSTSTQTDQNIAVKQDEIESELVDQLTPENKKLLSQLENELITCRKRKKELKTQIDGVEKKKSSVFLRMNQLKRYASAQKKLIQSFKQDELNLKNSIDMAKPNCDNLLSELRMMSNRYKDLDREFKEARSERAEAQMWGEQYLSRAINENRDAERLENMSDEYQLKINNCLNFFHTWPGITPDILEGTNIEELREMLNTNVKQLREYSHVIKNHSDRHLACTKKRKELQLREANIKKFEKSISD